MTVINGISRELPSSYRSIVAVRQDTWSDVYPTPQVVRYIAEGKSKSAFQRLRQKLLGWPLSYGDVAEIVRDTDPDWIFAHNGRGLGWTPEIRRPRALWLHNELFKPPPGTTKLILKNFSAIITVSQFLADAMCHKLGRGSPPISIVRNGVDTAKFRPVDRESQTPRVTFVGRILPIKGVHHLVQACLPLSHLDFELRIIGSAGFNAGASLSDYERDLRHQASPLGSRVKFIPFVPPGSIPSLLSSPTIAVFPSDWAEPFGLSILEAMSCGAATIATRVGGIPEFADGAATLVPHGASPELTEVLEALLQDPTALAFQASRCRMRALEWSWRQSADDLERWLER